ncbi:MAG: DUF4097 family beta strand repeat-containing protein [Bacteroidota bacterium]
MKYSNIIWMVVILLFGSLAVQAQADSEFTIPLTSPDKKGKLEVDIKSGSITVKCTPRKDILIKYESLSSSEVKMEKASNGLKKINGGITNLEVYEEDNMVSIESDNWNKGVNLYIETPQNMDMELSAYNNGDVSLEGAVGNIEIENYNGSITAKDISGTLIADTYNGDIKVSFLKLTPDIPLAFTTYNGNVDLTLPAATKASVKVRSNYGDIFTGFDMQFTKPKPQVQKEKRKMYIDGWFTGDINGGGPEFRMENYHGDIYIRKLGS